MNTIIVSHFKIYFIFLLSFLFLVSCQDDEKLLCPELTVYTLPIESNRFSTIQISENEVLRYETVAYSSFELPFLLENTGGNILKIGEIQSSLNTDSTFNFEIIQPLKNKFETNETDSFKIKVAGLNIGNYQIPITILSNDWNEPSFTFFIKLIIIAPPAPKLPNIKVYQQNTFIPSQTGVYTFENTKVGQRYEVFFRIKNEGQSKLIISNLLSTATDFIVENVAQNQLLPNQETAFRVIFSPTSVRTHSTQIKIQNNDPNNEENPYIFTIMSNPKAAPEPDIAVFYRQNNQNTELQNGFEFVEGGDLETGFEEIFEFEIENKGNATLNIASLSSNNSSFAISNITQNSLEPNQKTRFFVRFTAVTLGENIGIISIQSNDPNENPFTFKIRFTVKEPAFRIKYKTVTIPDGLNTVPSNTGENRTLFQKEFDVIDPQNLVNGTAILRVKFTASSGGSDSFSVTTFGTDGRQIIFQNDFDNFLYRQSIRFAEADYLDFEVYLELPTGQKSNLEKYRLLRPSGAN